MVNRGEQVEEIVGHPRAARCQSSSNEEKAFQSLHAAPPPPDPIIKGPGNYRPEPPRTRDRT